MKRFLLVAIAVALVGVPTAVLGQTAPSPVTDAVAPADPDTVPGEAIIGFVGFPDAVRTGTYAGYRVVEYNEVLGWALVEAPSVAVVQATLAADANVRYVEPQRVFHAQYTPADPFWMNSDYTWGQYQIWADVAWDKTRGTTAAKVCVADTGLYKAHEEFAGQSRVLQGWDFVFNDNDPNDANGHGTHVAGIIGATINNNKGIPGLAQAAILPARVLNGQGSGTSTQVANGVQYCGDQGAHILSMSLGGAYDATIANAVSYTQGKGTLVIAAAGNDGCACTSYPAGLSGVIGVAAVDKSLNKATFSNTGPAVDISAPGVSIVSTYNSATNSYVYLDGTSMATPFVSGVAALVKTYHPTWSASTISNQLTSTAQDLGAAGRDNSFGYGLVRADRAVV